MDRSDENSMIINRQENIQGGHAIGGGKALVEVGRTRRALSTINPNVVGQNPQGMGNKRGLGKEKQVVPAKVIRANRPMTRKRAAELANNQQHSLVDTHGTSSLNQNPIESSSSNQKSSESDDCLIIDVEEYQAANNSKGPIKEVEERFDEIDEMDEDQLEEHDEIGEDEMEEIVPQPVRKAMDIVGGQSVRKGAEPIRRDIDGNDWNNPLAVVEYVKDIYSFHKDNENSGRVAPNYMDEQDDINGRMRAILIDWLIEVHYKFDLMDETLFLMVNLIDRFLARKVVERKKLQLVGVTALLLACKYEEISVPVVEDLIVITDRAYSRKEVLDMEKLIVNTLQFNMSVPTAYIFMRRFLKVVQSDRRLELLSFFILELCLVEYEMLQFSPSLLAAAAIFTAQCTINRFKHWNSTSEWHTTYSEDELLECSKLMVVFHQRAGTGKLTGVHKKYSLIKFGYVARSEPASFLLQDASLVR